MVHTMRGKRSAVSLEARRRRAIDRGFLVPRESGMSHVAIPQRLAKNFQKMKTGVLIHDCMQERSGRAFHHARSAVMANREGLSPAVFSTALRGVQDAGRGKHRVPMRSPFAAEGGGIGTMAGGVPGAPKVGSVYDLFCALGK